MSNPTNTEVFAATLAENFRDVKFSQAKQAGTATIPGVGIVEFKEASNDPAVILNLTFTKRFKGSAETALDFLERLQQAWKNSD